jgi:hypothetical protein
MYSKNILQTHATETLEDKMMSKGMFAGAVSYHPIEERIYLGDARDGYLEKDDMMIDVGLWRKAKVLGASGDTSKFAKWKIFGNKYLQMLANKKKIAKIQEKSYEPLQVIGDRIVGAAGPTATTDYEAIRRTGDLLDGVIGQEHTNEDYQAINIAEVVKKDSVRFEYLTRTSARIIAQRQIADDQEANPLRHVYSSATKDIFAYGLQFISSMRDNIDTKTDVVADFVKQVPDSILAAKNEDVVTLLNAVTGTNQGDWDAFTSGIADVQAAADVQTAEDAVKAYGRPLVAIMPSDSWRGYMKNLQGAYFQGQPQNIANQSTSTPGAKSGQLLGNPGVTYFIDDALTAATYCLAAKPSYMKYFQAMVVMTAFTNVKTPGKAEQRFWYDFAGFEETSDSALYKGTSVLS